MKCIVDANVLFPLLVRGHVANKAAGRWWQAQPDDGVGLCLVVRLAVLRLLSNRAAMGGSPIAPTAALEAWRQLEEDPRCCGIVAAPDAHEGLFRALVHGRDATPNLWNDAWLGALAQSLDYELTTFDRGFRAFKTIKLHLLVASGRVTLRHRTIESESTDSRSLPSPSSSPSPQR